MRGECSVSDEVKVSEKKEGYFPIDLLSKGTVLEKNKKPGVNNSP